MKKFKTILFLICIYFNVNYVYAGDSFMTFSGKTYSEARNNASRLLASQGLKIVGQNYTKSGDGSWNLILKVRSKY